MFFVSGVRPQGGGRISLSIVFIGKSVSRVFSGFGPLKPLFLTVFDHFKPFLTVLDPFWTTPPTPLKTPKKHEKSSKNTKKHENLHFF